MAFDEKRLAAILQVTRDFAKDIIEETGGLAPFGGQVPPESELEFFAFAPGTQSASREDAYREVETVLIEKAKANEIVAGVIALDMVVPETIEAPFRNAIGIVVETPDFARFFYATYRLTPAAEAGGKGSVEYGKIFPLEAPRAIFAA